MGAVVRATVVYVETTGDVRLKKWWFIIGGVLDTTAF